MFRLSDKKIVLKKIAIFGSSAILLLLVTIAVVNRIANNLVEAASSQVVVSHGDSTIEYGDGAQTRYYTVTIEGENHNALCAEPTKAPPSGPYDFSVLDNNKIKLLVYLATVHNTYTNTLVNALYGNLASDDDQRFAYIHATIGAISGDYYGLSGTTREKINNIANGSGNGSIAQAISNNDDAWLIAKNYKLYHTNPGDSIYQAVVWIEEDPQYGNISIQKCDSETNSCTTPQGSGSFSGIVFSIYNNSGARFYYPVNGRFYNNGDLISTATTDTNGQASFTRLPIGIQYRITETSTNNSYLLTASDVITTISSAGATNNLQFKNNIKRGDVKFTKKDENSEENMANTAFKIQSNTTGESHIVVTDPQGIVNTSAIAHTENTNGYDNLEESQLTYLGYGTWFNGVSPTSSIEGAAVDDDKGALPYDEYTITELECDANKFCYDIDTESQTFTIDSNSVTVDLGEWENDCAEFSLNTTAKDADDNDKFIETSRKSAVKDTISYCAMPGKEYTIEGILMNKNTGQELLIDNKPVTNQITINPTGKCGTAEMTFEFDSSKLGGAELVVFESMYYNEELVTSHKDIDDEKQTIGVISLTTTATDSADGDKILAVNQDVKINDKVDYCLKEGVEFVIKGIVMDKTTKKPLIVDGKKIERTVKFTPGKACGAIDMVYDFNTNGIGGTDLIIFEDLYYDNELILSHKDFDNEDQSVSVAPNPPETGFINENQDSINSTNILIPTLVVIGAGGYSMTRLISRRKFYQK